MYALEVAGAARYDLEHEFLFLVNVYVILLVSLALSLRRIITDPCGSTVRAPRCCSCTPWLLMLLLDIAGHHPA